MPLDQLCGLIIPKNWQQMAPYEDDVFGRTTWVTPFVIWDW
jgi:hypothetical protein